VHTWFTFLPRYFSYTQLSPAWPSDTKMSFKQETAARGGFRRKIPYGHTLICHEASIVAQIIELSYFTLFINPPFLEYVIQYNYNFRALFKHDSPLLWVVGQTTSAITADFGLMDFFLLKIKDA
jgi:hypothetical protein